MKQNMALRTFIFSLLFLLPLTMAAQTIKGKVTNSSGEALPYMNIIEKGNSSNGTISDDKGEFSLDVKILPTTLVISSMGFETKRVKVSTTSYITIAVNDDNALGEVVITGTRSKPRTVLQSAVPIDNIGVKAIERQNNGDIVQTLKALIPSYTSTPLTGDGSAFVKPTSLRGLPPDEVLILMNSKRRHRSSLIAHFGAAMNAGSHAADVGHIPSIALKNIEVLRDGAAAQYGSDAIAGVMNFILKDASEGVEVQTQVGKWYGRNYGSETDYKVGMNFGFPLTENGFINISAEYAFNPKLARGNQHAAAQSAQQPEPHQSEP